MGEVNDQDVSLAAIKRAALSSPDATIRSFAGKVDSAKTPDQKKAVLLEWGAIFRAALRRLPR